MSSLSNDFSELKRHKQLVGDIASIRLRCVRPTFSTNSRIYRQRGADYRSAVEDLSRGDVGKAFAKLDQSGSIRTVDPLQSNAALVQDYVDTVRKGKSALVVSPTHAQGESISTATHLFGRYRYTNVIGSPKQNFYELQIGYSFFISNNSKN